MILYCKCQYHQVNNYQLLLLIFNPILHAAKTEAQKQQKHITAPKYEQIIKKNVQPENFIYYLPNIYEHVMIQKENK